MLMATIFPYISDAVPLPQPVQTEPADDEMEEDEPLQTQPQQVMRRTTSLLVYAVFSSMACPEDVVPPIQVFKPGHHGLGEGEELDYDRTAYDCLHKWSLPWPCLRCAIPCTALPPGSVHWTCTDVWGLDR